MSEFVGSILLVVSISLLGYQAFISRSASDISRLAFVGCLASLTLLSGSGACYALAIAVIAVQFTPWDVVMRMLMTIRGSTSDQIKAILTVEPMTDEEETAHYRRVIAQQKIEGAPDELEEMTKENFVSLQECVLAHLEKLLGHAIQRNRRVEVNGESFEVDGYYSSDGRLHDVYEFKISTGPVFPYEFAIQSAIRRWQSMSSAGRHYFRMNLVFVGLYDEERKAAIRKRLPYGNDFLVYFVDAKQVAPCAQLPTKHSGSSVARGSERKGGTK